MVLGDAQEILADLHGHVAVSQVIGNAREGLCLDVQQLLRR
jgi:hypothetical protein